MYLVRPSRIEVDTFASLAGENGTEYWGWDSMFRAMKKSERFTPPSDSVKQQGNIEYVLENHGTNGPLGGCRFSFSLLLPAPDSDGHCFKTTPTHLNSSTSSVSGRPCLTTLASQSPKTRMEAMAGDHSSPRRRSTLRIGESTHLKVIQRPLRSDAERFV